jgi:hypothetical protein
VSVSTLRQLQHGASRRVQNRTLSAISTALDWPEDHLAGVLLLGRHSMPAAAANGPDPVLDGLHAIQEQLTGLGQRLTEIEALLRAHEH